jgi:DNA polymerase-3 subunit chi
MTSIDFYFNADDRLQVACRLAAKAASQGKRLLVHTPDPELAGRFDKMLWTWQALAFVPHCAAHDPLAAETPVLLSGGEETPAGCDVILNLGAGCPPHFERFARLLEIVGAEDAERDAGRERYKFYQTRGYKISSHDLRAAQ